MEVAAGALCQSAAGWNSPDAVRFRRSIWSRRRHLAVDRLRQAKRRYPHRRQDAFEDFVQDAWPSERSSAGRVGSAQSWYNPKNRRRYGQAVNLHGLKEMSFRMSLRNADQARMDRPTSRSPDLPFACGARSGKTRGLEPRSSMNSGNKWNREPLNAYKKATRDWLLRLEANDVARGMSHDWLRWCEADTGNLQGLRAHEARLDRHDRLYTAIDVQVHENGTYRASA